MAELSSRFVPSDGPVDSPVMIIGEAPGEIEDKEGRPFAGRAGKVLNDALSFAGLPRETVYVTNVVPYRPVGNATPTREQIEKYAVEHLVPEFKKVLPDFVLILGNTALSTVTDLIGITRCRGWIPEAHHVFGELARVYATVHPSAVLHNPTLATTFLSDIAVFAKEVQQFVHLDEATRSSN